MTLKTNLGRWLLASGTCVAVVFLVPTTSSASESVWQMAVTNLVTKDMVDVNTNAAAFLKALRQARAKAGIAARTKEQERRKAFDRNGDGNIDPNQIDRFREKTLALRTAQRKTALDLLRKRYDTDKNTVVSRAEVREALDVYRRITATPDLADKRLYCDAIAMVFFDLDGDGMINAAERRIAENVRRASRKPDRDPTQSIAGVVLGRE